MCPCLCLYLFLCLCLCLYLCMCLCLCVSLPMPATATATTTTTTTATTTTSPAEAGQAQRWEDPWVRAAGIDRLTWITDSPAVTSCLIQTTTQSVEGRHAWGLWKAGQGGLTEFSQSDFIRAFRVGICHLSLPGVPQHSGSRDAPMRAKSRNCSHVGFRSLANAPVGHQTRRNMSLFVWSVCTGRFSYLASWAAARWLRHVCWLVWSISGPLPHIFERRVCKRESSLDHADWTLDSG